MSTDLTPELEGWRHSIKTISADYGLDFYEVIFEVLDWNQINAVAAYGGFPNRYPHWRFGMEYEQISKSYAYGLSKIYEMVINNNPSYAYLLHSNKLVDQKMVMAHVYGHVDFFKNNVYFSGTNRKMMDKMGDHRVKMQNFINRIGIDRVEEFLDTCLSIDNLIDIHRLDPTFPRQKNTLDYLTEEEENIHAERLKIEAPSYMEEFVNPVDFIEEQEKKKKEEEERRRRFPSNPESDVLLFLIENAPLRRWERDILWIVRQESYYFAPQARTKIMNEGWAVYWHTKMMTERLLDPSELIDYADHHSGTASAHPGRLNPYHLGFYLFKYIEEKWNKGKFGLDYERCDDMKEKTAWDRKIGKGREKIFNVRKLYNDLTFIDEFMDQEFCEEHKYFTYGYNRATGMYEIMDRDHRKIKEKLLQMLTNRGTPSIQVINGNGFNRNELILKHNHFGFDLRVDWAFEVLKNIHRVWKRPVHIETILEGVSKRLTYNGKETREEKILEAG